MLKAIIFDMDGVLIDSEPTWDKAEIQVMKELYNIELTMEHIIPTQGFKIEEAARYFQHLFHLPASAEKNISEKVTKMIIEFISNEGEALAGVKETLAWLKTTDLKVGLASSSSMPIIEATLERLELKDYFISLNSADKLAYGKPHPMVYLQAAENLGVLPQDCLAIEDTVNGSIAGKAAQMQVVAIPAETSQNNPKYAIVDHQLSSMFELKSCLEQHYQIK